MDLATLIGLPELSVEIRGRLYQFSELPIDSLARLQAWVKANVPHPLDVVKGHLDGLPDGDRRYLLDQARIDARSWPPVVGTAAGAAALLSTEPGQFEAFFEGLLVHQPATVRNLARSLFRGLRADAAKAAQAAQKEGREFDGESTARSIFAVLFGLGSHLEADDEGQLPKA